MPPRAFLAGHPVKHSRSPLIHGYWLRRHGLEGSYEVLDVPPADFPTFLRTFRDRGYIGGNVTIPHKEAAFQGVDRATSRARRIGAVNTVFVEDGAIVGDNTDGIGYLAHLDQTFGPGWSKTTGTALVLGAGGAARAIVASLAERGLSRILLANRNPSRAQALAKDFAPDPIEPVAWDDVPALLDRTDLLVNTTSLGMVGQPPLDLPLDRLPSTARVSDIVYVPLETPLLAAARACGLQVCDGLGMLLHQAVPGFAAWFGLTPVVDDGLRALIVADLPA